MPKCQRTGIFLAKAMVSKQVGWSREQESQVGERLARYGRFGVNLGLERIQRLLAALGNPQEQVAIAHVAGTNGKGSVCAYLSSVLTAAGYRVGRYTSPHLVSWGERICLNNVSISAADLLAALDTVEGAIATEQEMPTQFEVLTAAAWVYFAEQQVDLAVVEVGLGGRLDATNVVDRPLVSVITSLSREHWQVLGPTLADIAREKAGILKRDRPAVVGPLPPAAERVVLDRAQALGCPVFRPQPAQWDAIGNAVSQPCLDASGTVIDPGGLILRLPFPGIHQLGNVAIAIAALAVLRQQGWHISDEALQNGLEQARWPGRLQWLQWHGSPWLVDGAHNPAAAQVLRQYVEAISQPHLPPVLAQPLQARHLPIPVPPPTTWLMGMLSTKDHADVFRALLRPGDRLHLVPVPDHATMEPAALRQIALAECPDLGACETYPSLAAGLQGAIADPTHLRVLCGSLYLVGHFFATQSWTD